MTPPDSDQDPEAPGPDDRLIGVPGFASGGYVARTGIALVHEGEYIVPAAGSDAVISSGAGELRTAQVVNYYFPVEVQVLGVPSRDAMREVAEYVYDELMTALGSV